MTTDASREARDPAWVRARLRTLLPLLPPKDTPDALLTRLDLPISDEERALYAVDAPIEIDGAAFDPCRLLVLRPGLPVTVRAARGARLFLLGGATLDGPRHLWWNFVASSPGRIEAAKERWRAGAFPPVPGEHERIPLPDA